VSSRQIEDRVTGGSATCEIHNAPMGQKRVEESFGMRVTTPMDLARPVLFPHADEPYDTRACARSYKFARVFVCAACTEARTNWLQTYSRTP
jgi:hypothetical protein